MTIKVLVKGRAEGTVLKTQMPINFLGTVDKADGTITDRDHELFGKTIRDTILVFPSGVGSSVGAYTIYSIKSNGAAPLAMICKKADLTVATGCAVADIPLVVLSEEEAYESLNSGDEVLVDMESEDIISKIVNTTKKGL